jgi:hypothetical protein
MKNILFILLCFFSAQILFAQSAIGNDLTVWSEDGLLFTLYLNGQKMNEQPSASVLCRDVTVDYANGRVVFAGDSLPDLERKILQIKSNPQFRVASTVFKIVSKKGGMDFKWVSSNEKAYAPSRTIIIDNNNPPPAQGTTIQIHVPNR